MSLLMSISWWFCGCSGPTGTKPHKLGQLRAQFGRVLLQLIDLLLQFKVLLPEYVARRLATRAAAREHRTTRRHRNRQEASHRASVRRRAKEDTPATSRGA